MTIGDYLYQRLSQQNTNPTDGILRLIRSKTQPRKKEEIRRTGRFSFSLGRKRGIKHNTFLSDRTHSHHVTRAGLERTQIEEDTEQMAVSVARGVLILS